MSDSSAPTPIYNSFSSDFKIFSDSDFGPSGFLRALCESDDNIVATFGGSFLKSVSSNVQSIIGIKCDSGPVTPFLPSPRRGAMFCRSHEKENICPVLFHNTFWKHNRENTELYTIDRVVTTNAYMDVAFVLNSAGSVTKLWNLQDSAQGSLNSHGIVVGDHLSKVLPSSDFYSVLSLIESLQGTVLEERERIIEVKFTENDKYATLSFYSLLRGAGSASDEIIVFMKISKEPTNTASKEELMHELRYLRDFRDNISLPMYSIDATQNIAWANDAMCDLMGYSKEEYLCSSVSRYHVDREKMNFMMCEVSAGNRLKNYHTQLRRKDGEVLDVTYNSSAHFDENGKFAYSRCVVQDMSESLKLKAANDALEREKIEAMVRERTAAQASKMKSQFLATMSHEIRTPIHGVIAASSLLDSTEISSVQKEYVDIISSSANMLMSLVNNILDISKIESGFLQLENIDTNLCSLVRDCCRVVDARAKEKLVEVVAELSPRIEESERHYYCDPTRVRQVMLNFLSNAIKFSHERGIVRCIVTATAKDPPGLTSGEDGGDPTSGGTGSEICLDASIPDEKYDVVRIEVVDTGIGIEDCSGLYSPFQQASKQISEVYGGSGLGLVISKRIVEMMGGEVGIHSALGEGTTVWAEFPLRCSSTLSRLNSRSTDSNEAVRLVASGSNAEAGCSTGPVDADIDAVAVPALLLTKNNSGGDGADSLSARGLDEIMEDMRILVAEDNKVNQKLLVRMLATLNCKNIDVASNGQEAVDKVKELWATRRNHYDVIWMDCLMPVMDGLEATKAIRTYESEVVGAGECDEHPRASIFALTANATEEDRRVTRAIGMDGFYVKPITKDRINAILREWAAQRRLIL